MQCQTVEQFVILQQVLPDAIHNQVKQLMLLVQKQRDRQIPNLLFRVLIRTDQIDCLQVSKVDVPPEDVNVQQLADIFLAVVSIEVTFPELLPYVRELSVDAFLFQIACPGIAKIGYELHEASHGRGIARASTAQEARRRARQGEGCASATIVFGGVVFEYGEAALFPVSHGRWAAGLCWKKVELGLRRPLRGGVDCPGHPLQWLDS